MAAISKTSEHQNIRILPDRSHRRTAMAAMKTVALLVYRSVRSSAWRQPA